MRACASPVSTPISFIWSVTARSCAMSRSPQTAEERGADRSVLNVEDILHYADETPLEAVAPLLERQIAYNSAIAREGLSGAWGAQIGRILLEDYGDDVKQRAKAYAAAGSDARMSGCEKPVVILSGSGNQGITACMPVVVYAEHIGATREQLHRALLVSDLITVHQKRGIGRLSAYCGAISAGVGAGAGICYLLGGGYEAVAHTVVNAVAILSGHDLRRREAVLRGQDRRCGRRRDIGLPDVPAPPRILPRRGHRRQLGRRNDRKRRRAGAARECARPTPRSWRSCRNDRLWEKFHRAPARTGGGGAIFMRVQKTFVRRTYFRNIPVL